MVPSSTSHVSGSAAIYLEMAFAAIFLDRGFKRMARRVWPEEEQNT
jgi:hypothetical protein